MINLFSTFRVGKWMTATGMRFLKKAETLPPAKLVEGIDSPKIVRCLCQPLLRPSHNNLTTAVLETLTNLELYRKSPALILASVGKQKNCIISVVLIHIISQFQLPSTYSNHKPSHENMKRAWFVTLTQTNSLQEVNHFAINFLCHEAMSFLLHFNISATKKELIYFISVIRISHFVFGWKGFMDPAAYACPHHNHSKFLQTCHLWFKQHGLFTS